MPTEKAMSHEPTPHFLFFGVVTSIYCYIMSHYLVMSSWQLIDVLFTILMKLTGTMAALATTLGFIFKNEKRLFGYYNKVKHFFHTIWRS